MRWWRTANMLGQWCKVVGLTKRPPKTDAALKQQQKGEACPTLLILFLVHFFLFVKLCLVWDSFWGGIFTDLYTTRFCERVSTGTCYPGNWTRPATFTVLQHSGIFTVFVYHLSIFYFFHASVTRLCICISWSFFLDLVPHHVCCI